MRRDIRAALPSLAYHFGLRPADIDEMPDGEVVVFLEALADIAREREKG